MIFPEQPEEWDEDLYGDDNDFDHGFNHYDPWTGEYYDFDDGENDD
jgi:hypothetical protein